MEKSTKKGIIEKLDGMLISIDRQGKHVYADASKETSIIHSTYLGFFLLGILLVSPWLLLFIR